MSGTRQINMEKEWDDVESFVDELRTALDDEAKTIRETELDQVGGYQEAALTYPREYGIPPDSETDLVVDKDAQVIESIQVFVDKLGRVILPAKVKYEQLLSVTFLDEENGSEPIVRNVVRVETRFKGKKVSAYVVYLEARE